MVYLSVFRQFASIFLAYFLVSKVLSSAINNTIMVSISSVVLLGGLELLKREVFDKFSINQLKANSFFSKDVLPLLLFQKAMPLGKEKKLVSWPKRLVLNK